MARERIPSLDFVQRRIGELTRELSLLRSLRRALRRHQRTTEVAADFRRMRTRRDRKEDHRDA